MRTLCLDARMLCSGGIGTFIQQLILALYKNVQLIALIYKKDAPWFASYPEIILIEMRAPIYSIKEHFELQTKIPRCDIFFAPHFNSPLLPIKAIKRLSCIHDAYHLAHPLPLIQKVYAHLLYNTTSFLSHHITTVSEFSKKEICRYSYIKPKNITVIHSVVPPHYFRPIDTIPFLQGSYILFVGNVKPHKNIQRLLHAYNKLNCKERLVIVGRRDGFINCEKEFSALSDKIIFTNYITDVQLHALYAHARLFVFPSLYEGFGLPPLEAMAMGCPVVAAASGSIPEICGQGVHYVDPFSEDSIAEGIQRSLTDESYRTQLIAEGKKVAANYGFTKFKEAYLKLIYESCDRT